MAPLVTCRASMWGHSSAGRALAWHARGRRFDPAWLHQPPGSLGGPLLPAYNVRLAGQYQIQVDALIGACRAQVGVTPRPTLSPSREACNLPRPSGLVRPHRLEAQDIALSRR